MRATRGVPRTRQRWMDEERREILQALYESGTSVQAFGEAIGVSWSLLYKWRRRYGAVPKDAP